MIEGVHVDQYTGLNMLPSLVQPLMESTQIGLSGLLSLGRSGG